MTVKNSNYRLRCRVLSSGANSFYWCGRYKIRIFAALFLIVSMVAGAFQSAAATEWVVKRVSGPVYFVAPGLEAFRARKGMVFQKGFTLATRSRARALIARGTETITVGPETTVALSKRFSNRGKTTLLQRKGKVTVDVAKRNRPHFYVETPFLAAVVKGTKFDVSVDSRRARVSVQRGGSGSRTSPPGTARILEPARMRQVPPVAAVGLMSAAGRSHRCAKGAQGNRRSARRALLASRKKPDMRTVSNLPSKKNVAGLRLSFPDLTLLAVQEPPTLVA